MTNNAFKETEIRPDHLRDAQAARFMADVRRLMENQERFVVVACPACDSSAHSPAFKKYDLSYQECSDCKTVYISPRPPPDVLDSYYANSENYAFWNKYVFPASAEVRREKIFRPRAERLMEICARHNVKMGTLLEVGAAFGLFCEEAKRLGNFRHVIAVEPTPDLAQTCRDKGLEVIEKPIEQVNLQGSSVDVVASFEVIEHLFSARDFVVRCGSFLSEGGLLVLTCPNVQGFDVAVLRELSDTVDVEHLNYFHPDSLARLVTSCGFEVLEVMTPGALDAELVRKKALAGDFNLSSQPFLQHILLEKWDEVGAKFQDFLADNGLSSHMWLVAKKKS